jgi:hypothetical protein
MNIFILTLSIILIISSIINFSIIIYFLTKKIIPIKLVSFFLIFSSGALVISSFLVLAQEIENYRGNPKNNQEILGEETVNE